MTNTERLLADTLANGGATVDPNVGPWEPYVGGWRGDWLVGGCDHGQSCLTVPAPFDGFEAAVALVLARHPGTLLGTWLDGETIHIDTVESFLSRENATAIGRLNGQKAIFNVATGETVTL